VRLPRLIRTTAFRLALAYAAWFALSTALLFALIYLAVIDYVEEQLYEAVEEATEMLVERARTEGLDALAARLRTLEESIPGGPVSYLLLDPDGRVLAGELASIGGREGWFEFVEPGDDDGDPMLGLGTPLAGGGFLLVAQTSEDQRDLREAVIWAFGWAMSISLALAVLGGLATSAIFLRRLEGFNRTAARIVDGRLGERVPGRGTDDEFDRLANNLNAMLDRIQALMESMRQVSNDIAHDLRTPLSHLRQRLDLARQTARDVKAYEEAVDGAAAETDEILATFGALLRIAQIEAGTRRAGFAEVDLSAVFETIAETYAAVADDGGQSLVATIEASISVRGDRELLTQMFANLVENAIRHTPPGTAIQLSLVASGSGPIGTVADNGPGIPEAARDKIFRRFFRLEASRTTPGSGLGLSLAAAVAELHGLTIELSDAAPGLVVTLRFPPHREERTVSQ
jgi:signal transduction histidine kinase